MKKVTLAVLIVLFLSFSLASAEAVKRLAVVIETQGTVEVKTASRVWVPAQTGMALNPDDAIRTGKNSYAILNLDGNAQTATVEVKEKSEVELAEMLANKEEGTQKTMLDLSLGSILIKAKKLHSEKSSFEVKTPTSVVAVRGTTFSVSVEALE